MRIVLCLLVVFSCSVLLAQPRVIPPSGKVGEKVTSFQAVKAAGPPAESEPGTLVSYYDLYTTKPTAIVFSNEVNDGLRELVAALDELIGKDESKELCAYVVLYGKNPETSEALSKKFCESTKPVNIPIVYPNAVEQFNAFRSYGVTANAKTTMTITLDGKVFSTVAATPKKAMNDKFIDNLKRAASKAAPATAKAGAEIASSTSTPPKPAEGDTPAAPAKPRVPAALPIAEVATQLKSDIAAIDKMLASEESFQASAKDFQRVANGSVAMAVVLAKDESEHRLKAAARQMLPATIKLCEAENYLQAKAEMEQIHEALEVKSSDTPEPDWVKLPSIKQVMQHSAQMLEEMTSKEKEIDARKIVNARYSAQLAALFKALRNDRQKVADDAEFQKWQLFCDESYDLWMDYGKACRTLNARDQTKMNEYVDKFNTASQRSCLECHKDFKKCHPDKPDP